MALTLKKKPASMGLKKPGLAKPGGLKKPGKVGEFGATGPKVKVSKSGAFGAADKAIAQAEHKKSQPWRFSIPVGMSGVEVYFLDKGEPFYMYEHQLNAGPGKRGDLFPCIKDTNENCPGCNKDPKGEGKYVMLLTAVIPKITLDTKEGKKTYTWQKKEFPIKIKMVKKYQRLFQAHGGFRGMVVKISRDGEMDAGTGNDVEFVRMMPEKEIQKWANRDPKLKDLKLAEAFDFEKVHKLPSAAELAKLIGSTSDAAGSADFGNEDDDGDDFEAAGGGWGE